MNAVRPRPLIGITLDSEEPGGYSKYPWYALRQNYMSAVAGGAFDVDPAMYGNADRHDTVVLKTGRTAAELALLRGALDRDMPLLGICGGEQLLAVALGGTLIQHIPDSIPDHLPHEQKTRHDEPGHPVALTAGSLLARIAGSDRMMVNTSHHQAVRDAGPGVIVNAVAPDGVVEGIEDSRYRFCLGVQWHPEFDTDPADRRIFAALIAACA
jgi:putative glutamine amidotransferase